MDPATDIKRVAWDDERTYRWSLHDPTGGLVGTISYLVGAAGLFPIGCFAILAFVHWFSPPVAKWLAIVSGSIFLMGFVSGFSKIARDVTAKDRMQNAWNSACCAVAVFGILLFLLWQDHLFTGCFKNGEHAGFFGWLGYLMDRMCEIVLFDIPNVVFGFHFSNIEPSNWMGKAVQWLLKAMIVAGAIQAVVLVWAKRYASNVAFIGTLRELYWHCELLPNTNEVEVELVGYYQKVDFAWRYRAQDIMSTFREDAAKSE